MGNEYSWEVLEQRFTALSNSLKDLRVDYQWGSVPEAYHFALYNDQNSLAQFCAFASLAGKKLIESKDIYNLPAEIYSKAEPLYV